MQFVFMNFRYFADRVEIFCEKQEKKTEQKKKKMNLLGNRNKMQGK